jgi:uncharacterized protein (UPF0276 family)
MTKITTPISHLFEDRACAEKIIEHSDCLECRDSSIESAFPGQEVFHCDIQPIHRLSGKDLDHLERIKRMKPELRLLTFHIASCCDGPVVDNMMFKTGGSVYTEKEMLDNAGRNLAGIKELFGDGVEIAVENNNYYPTDAYKHVTEPGFISKLVRDNGIKFLFDVAHARVTSCNKGMGYEGYRDALPLDRAVQIHISTYAVNKDDGMAYDMHEYPAGEDFSEVAGLLKNLEIKYLGIEYYKDTENLIRSLKRMRELI